MTLRFILGLIIGALLGASLALALAPQQGVATRQRLAGKMEERSDPGDTGG